MPLSGGPADKVGNRYESGWTVSFLIEMLLKLMDEELLSIRLEPPGENLAEFWIQYPDGRRIFYQVKRQRSAGPSWTLAALHEANVLTSFWEKLSENKTCFCAFVSEYPAHELKHLVEDASGAKSFDEFQEIFSKAKSKQEWFSDLCTKYLPTYSREEIYEGLKRVIVDFRSEGNLFEANKRSLKFLIDAPPENVYAVLVQLANNSIHKKLTAYNIWHYLEKPEHGFRRRHIVNDPHTVAKMQEVNATYFSSKDDATIGGCVLLRESAQNAVRILTDVNTSQNVLLTGEAGNGKSGVFQQIVGKLVTLGIPVLVFGIDQLDPVLLPRDIGLQRGLPDSPVHVLAMVAQGHPCVLALDQLDAINRLSDQSIRFLQCIRSLLAEAHTYPHLRILVAIRQFDLNHDEDLQQLFREDNFSYRITIDPFPESQTRETVELLGGSTNHWSEQQLKLLSCPLHMRLFAKIADTPFLDLNFKTENDLYRRFWEQKDKILRRKLSGQPINWTAVVDKIATSMSDRQLLFAPESIVSQEAYVVDAVVSENILNKTGKRLSFFHESFFDYIFARQFLAQQNSLVSFLLQDEQHFFRREQVRHILLQERSEDIELQNPRYCHDLNALLTEDGIRAHIKQVVFTLLAELDEPAIEEWQVLDPLLDNASYPYLQDIWKILYGSAPWFHLLDAHGVVTNWLLTKDRVSLEQKMRVLLPMQRSVPDRVVELVAPFVGEELWRKHFVSLILRSDLRSSRLFLDFFLRLISDGILDQMVEENSSFWVVILNLPQAHADWACEVTGKYLERRLLLTAAAGSDDPFAFSVGASPIPVGTGFFQECAEKAPLPFVANILPFMLLTMNQALHRSGTPPWKDSVWGQRYYGETDLMSSELLMAMVQALRHIAVAVPEYFAQLAMLLKTQKYETAHFLLICSYEANGRTFADDAVSYLCETPQRLQIGYLQDSSWPAYQLIAAISPHCSSDHLTQLENCLLGYYPDAEKKKGNGHWYGYTQLSLLGGIDIQRRSPKVTRKVAELTRKFKDRMPQAPEPFGRTVSIVPSPISSQAIEKMTDRQWIGAMTRYNQTIMDIQPDRFMMGGALQLSRELESQAKKDPIRFARLLCQLPMSVHPAYVDAILRGISEAHLDEQLVHQVCHFCHSLPDRPCGVWLCDFIEKQRISPFSSSILDMVVWYATANTDEGQRDQSLNQNGEWTVSAEDMLSTGRGMARGRAALTIGQLIDLQSREDFHVKSKLVIHFLLALETLAQDPSIAVKTCLIETLYQLLPHFREFAIRLFQRLDIAHEALLVTRNAARFLDHAVSTHFPQFEASLTLMLHSQTTELTVLAAEACSVASLLTNDAQNLIHACLSGTDAQRLGAARAFATNLGVSRCRDACQAALLPLFNDTSLTVRSEAAACFRSLRKSRVKTYQVFIETFLQSQAFQDAPYDLLHTLELVEPIDAELTYKVGETFLDIFASDVDSPYTTRGLQANLIGKLMISIYRSCQETKNEVLRRRSLTIIDRLVQIGCLDLSRPECKIDR